MKQTKMRYNYLSHMVDATSEAVIRIGKVSAFWASLAQLAIFINLIVYLGTSAITVAMLVVLQFLFWASVFCVLMFVQMSWVSYMVYVARDEWEYDDTEDNPPAPLPKTTTKYYIPRKNGYKLDKVVDTYGGEGGSDDS